jgi:hypothetical protein
MWLEGLGELKKFSDLIRTQTCDLLACSIVSQPTTLPCAPKISVIQIECCARLVVHRDVFRVYSIFHVGMPSINQLFY